MHSNATNAVYTVYMPNGPGALCDSFRMQEGALVWDLQNTIRDSPGFKALRNEKFILLKCGVLAMDPKDTRFPRVSDWLPRGAEMLPVHRLKHYFPSGPAPAASEMIDIVLVTDAILEACAMMCGRSAMDASRINKVRQSLAFEIGNLSSPSEGARTETGIIESNDGSRGVHCHRPAGNYGPPTTLFHPALARFKHRLEHLDQLEELEPEKAMLKMCHLLIRKACRVYDDWTYRESALQHPIENLVGECGIWQDRFENNTAHPTAIWGDIVRLILEVKSEVGIEGNASTQAMISYGKVIARPKYKTYVKVSNCPVILIGMSGTRMEISTAIFTDGIYVDKLVSEELCLDAWQSETVLRLGRIFKALSLAVAELEHYYCAFQYYPADPEPTNAHLFPDPLPVDGCVRIPKLKYLGKLSHHGKLISIIREKGKLEEDPERPFALYRAKMVRDEPQGEVDVVVKFTVQYNDRAHRILAENELAPALHFFAPVVGGMYMVVMDYINSRPLFGCEECQDYETIYNDTEKAIQLLHEEDIVFGDLRYQNIIHKSIGGAMLIDFDWAGKHQETKYPASWDTSKARWAEGVGRRKLMDKRHDIFMLEKLKAMLMSNRAG